MSSYPSVRRSRLLAAATVVAAVGTAALVPTAAFADAPTTGAALPLVATLAANDGQGPLTRGGNGADLTLTVTNDSDQEQPFHPAVNVKPVGSQPTGWSWIDFSAKAISAPATYGMRTFGTDGFSGNVLPEGAMYFVSFKVPAHTTYTWAVSFKLGAALPADDTAVNVELVNDQNDSTNSAPVALPVAAPTGALVQNFVNTGDSSASFGKPYETDLVLTNNGAAIDAAINPTLRYGDGSRPVPATLKLDVFQDDKWTAVPGSNNAWQLPSLADGLGQGQSHTYRIRLTVTDFAAGAPLWFSAPLSLQGTDQGPVDTSVKVWLGVNGTPLPAVK